MQAEHFAQEMRIQAHVNMMVDLHLAAPDAQASIDSLACENEVEIRIWTVATRLLSERSGEGRPVVITKM